MTELLTHAQVFEVIGWLTSFLDAAKVEYPELKIETEVEVTEEDLEEVEL